MKKLGIKLAIDDFGIGFASLSYLHKVPASTIKIDKSFIKNVGSSEKHKQIVKSIIDMGNNLQKDIIAEGVEDHDHLNFLNSQNCFKYQYYIITIPISVQDLGFNKVSVSIF